MASAAPLFPERIRDERFRQGGQRTVDHAPNFADRSGMVLAGTQEESDLVEIIRLLAAGSIVPERYYRNGIERDHDELLTEHGIKHLHLGSATSDVLLFLVEYDSKVLLLEINTHKHFESKPVGSVLRSLHDSAIRYFDAEAAADRHNRIAAKTQVVAKGLLPRRAR